MKKDPFFGVSKNDPFLGSSKKTLFFQPLTLHHDSVCFCFDPVEKPLLSPCQNQRPQIRGLTVLLWMLLSRPRIVSCKSRSVSPFFRDIGSTISSVKLQYCASFSSETKNRKPRINELNFWTPVHFFYRLCVLVCLFSVVLSVWAIHR